MERVTAHIISIKRKGEWNYFQVRLPKDAKKIIGIETGLKIPDEAFAITEQGNNSSELMERRSGAVTSFLFVGNTPAPIQRFVINRNRLMGDLKLQSLDDANIFYAKEIWADDKNINSDAITINNVQPPAYLTTLRRVDPPGTSMPKYLWRYGSKMEEDGILLCRNPVITGVYKDAIGKAYDTNFNYKVFLYIWHDG